MKRRKLYRPPAAPKPKPLPPGMPDARLFDLCRYMRSELLEKGLITMEEWGWLLYDCLLAQGDGSPSPRRLESYDDLYARFNAIKAKVEEIVCTKGEDAGVVMLSNDAPATRVEGFDHPVYDLEYFSPLGEALIEVYKLAGGKVE